MGVSVLPVLATQSVEQSFTPDEIAQRFAADQKRRGLPDGAAFGVPWTDGNGVSHLYVNGDDGMIKDALQIPTSETAADDGWEMDPSGLFWKRGIEGRPYKPWDQMTEAEKLAVNVAMSGGDTSTYNDFHPVDGSGPTSTAVQASKIIDAAKEVPKINPVPPPQPRPGIASIPSGEPTVDAVLRFPPQATASVTDVPPASMTGNKLGDVGVDSAIPDGSDGTSSAKTGAAKFILGALLVYALFLRK